MNLKYELTPEDDLNSNYTKSVLLNKRRLIFLPVRYVPHLILVISIISIVWGLLTPVPSDKSALLTLGVLCFLSSIFLLFIVYKPKQTILFFNRRDSTKQQKHYSTLQKQRNAILTAEEFIFQTGDSEMAWSWQALKSFKEAETGFEFCFYSGHELFIPKRIFADEQQLNAFKDLVTQYQNTSEAKANNILADYQLQLQNYIEAQQLIERNSKNFYINVALMLLLLSTNIIDIIRLENHDFLLVLAKYSIYYNLEQTNDERYTIIFFSLFSLLLFFGMVFPKLNPLVYWTTKLHLHKNFVKREAKQISITPEGMAIASQNYRQYSQWQTITKTVENHKIFLLYHSRDRHCSIVPKSIFTSEAELIDFRNLANSRK